MYDNDMTTKQVLEPGTVVQYRKVGTARLVQYNVTPSWSSEANEGWWTVEWIKAPKAYREGHNGNRSYWICPSDIVQ